MSKRAILYARVSGDDRKTSTSSIDGQLTDCRKYAQEQGYTIVGEYHEEANKQTSGADWLPELERVIRLAGQSFYDVLIVREVDRLARNRFKQMSVENELERLSVKVEYAIGRYEDTAEGRLLKGLMGEFAEFEREKIRQRTRRGMDRAVLAGNVQVSGNMPYGYQLQKENGRRVLVVNDYEAAIVAQIFDLYGNQGYSQGRIADYLTGRGIALPGKSAFQKSRLKDKGNNWSITAISVILSNETYIGNWYYRKTKTTKNPLTGKRKKTMRPKKQWLLVQVPPIIDQDLFELVQRRKQENKRQAGKQRQTTYLLGGMVDCGHCGVSMSGITRKDKNNQWTYYKCNARHTPKRYNFVCDNSVHYRANEVDAAVWAWIKELLLSPEQLNQSLQLHQEQGEADNMPLLNMIAANEKKLTALKAEKTRLIAAYAAGALSLDDIAQLKVDLDKQIADLGRAIAEFRAELDPKMLSAQEIDSIHEWAEQIREGVEEVESNPITIRQIFQLLQVKVTLSYTDKQQVGRVVCALGNSMYSRLSHSMISNNTLYIEKWLVIGGAKGERGPKKSG